jgi:hypothetical protein
MIPATLSIRADVLVISPVAIFLCIGILAFLIISTCVIYLINRRYFKLLPRDVILPASVLGFVYGSEKLKAWVEQQDELGSLDYGSRARFRWHGKAKAEEEVQSRKEEVLVEMGYFIDSAGKQRWGIELDTAPGKKTTFRLFSSTNAISRLPAGDDTEVP